MALESATDAVAFHPDIFPSGVEAAKKSLARLKGISGTFPYDNIFIRECPGNRPIRVLYRPKGRGQQTRRAWSRNLGAAQVQAMLGTMLGDLAMFQFGDAVAGEPAATVETPVAPEAQHVVPTREPEPVEPEASTPEPIAPAPTVGRDAPPKTNVGEPQPPRFRLCPNFGGSCTCPPEICRLTFSVDVLRAGGAGRASQRPREATKPALAGAEPAVAPRPQMAAPEPVAAAEFRAVVDAPRHTCPLWHEKECRCIAGFCFRLAARSNGFRADGGRSGDVARSANTA